MNEERQTRLNSQLRGAKIALIVVAAVLVFAIIGNIIYMNRSSKLSEQNELLTTEKNDLLVENNMLTESIDIKDDLINEQQTMMAAMEKDHDSIIAVKDARIASLSRRATANANNFQEQLQINEQLAEAIAALEAAKLALQDQLFEVQEERNELEMVYNQLQEKARQAERLNVYNITALTKWERWICADRYNVARAKRVDHTFIRFEVDGTIFTEAGPATIHLLMISPNGEVINPSANQFTVVNSGEESAYTQMEEINYQHEVVPIQFHLTHPERMEPGTYAIEVYVNGALARTKEIVFE